MSCQPDSSRPRAPNKAKTPMPATKVGITNGSINSRSTQPRPRKSSRAKAQATGTPNNTASTQVTAACAAVHAILPRR